MNRRVASLRSGTARTAMLAAAIRAAADDPSIVVVRIQLKYTRHDRPYHAITAYDAKYRSLDLDLDAVHAIDLLIRGGRPDIDWRFDHDWHLDTGILRRSPDIRDLGSIPDIDRTFGGGPPVFLVDAKPKPNRSAAA